MRQAEAESLAVGHARRHGHGELMADEGGTGAEAAATRLAPGLPSSAAVATRAAKRDLERHGSAAQGLRGRQQNLCAQRRDRSSSPKATRMRVTASPTAGKSMAISSARHDGADAAEDDDRVIAGP
jgi:hypothetical protein